jgi:hypothetical protein
MNVWEASAQARAGRAIRRAIWRNRWLSLEHGLRFLTPVNPVSLAMGRRRTVEARDLHGYDLRAEDWTIEPIPPIAPLPISFAPFDVAIIRYRWAADAGADLDTRTALFGTGDGAVDGVDLGYAHAAVLPAVGTPWITWGGDNTLPAGQEAVAVDFRQLALDFPAATEFRVRLRAHWFGVRLAGDIELEVETFAAGAVSPAGVNDLECAGDQVGQAVVLRNPVSRAFELEAGDDLGELRYDPSIREAILTDG